MDMLVKMYTQCILLYSNIMYEEKEYLSQQENTLQAREPRQPIRAHYTS